MAFEMVPGILPNQPDVVPGPPEPAQLGPASPMPFPVVAGPPVSEEEFVRRKESVKQALSNPDVRRFMLYMGLQMMARSGTTESFAQGAGQSAIAALSAVQKEKAAQSKAQMEERKVRVLEKGVEVKEKDLKQRAREAEANRELEKRRLAQQAKQIAEETKKRLGAQHSKYVDAAVEIWKTSDNMTPEQIPQLAAKLGGYTLFKQTLIANNPELVREMSPEEVEAIAQREWQKVVGGLPANIEKAAPTDKGGEGDTSGSGGASVLEGVRGVVSDAMLGTFGGEEPPPPGEAPSREELAAQESKRKARESAAQAAEARQTYGKQVRETRSEVAKASIERTLSDAKGIAAKAESQLNKLRTGGLPGEAPAKFDAKAVVEAYDALKSQYPHMSKEQRREALDLMKALNKLLSEYAKIPAETSGEGL